MNIAQIIEDISNGEGLNREFKEAGDRLPKNLFETICAFLNTDGGTIFLGVADNGKIKGIAPDAVKQFKADLANQSNNPEKINPPYLLFPHEYEIEGKMIIAVQVPLSSQLHTIKGITFLRSEDGDYQVSGTHQLAGLINRKLGLFSEQRVQPYASMDDLKPELFDKARRLMRSYNSQHPWIGLSNEELLKIGGFYATDPQTGKRCLNLAALLLFGSDEALQEAVPAYKFDCLLRRKNIDRYDDRLIIRTNLIDAYDLMMGFVEKHLNDPFYLENDMRISLRDKIFREAISNIISHREYISPAPARLIIYSDKVVLDNPSVQHHFGEITPENLRPFSKNPTICKFMIQLGRFDELGSGVTNINKYLPIYANGAKPVFKDTVHGFELSISLGDNSVTEETTHKTTHKTTQKAAGQVAGHVTGQVADEVTDEVTDEVRQMLQCIDKPLSRKEIQKKMNLKSEVNFRQRYLLPALNSKLIEMTQPDSPKSPRQKYLITEKGKQVLSVSS